MKYLACNILIFSSMLLIWLDLPAQSKAEPVDTLFLYEVLNSHLQKIEGKELKEPYLINLKSKLPYENDTSKENGFVIDLCPTSLEWNKDLIKSRLAIFKQADSIQRPDNYCFISCLKFNEAKTRCRIYSRISHGEWGSYAAFFYYKKIRGKWKFLRSALVSIS